MLTKFQLKRRHLDLIHAICNVFAKFFSPKLLGWFACCAQPWLGLAWARPVVVAGTIQGKAGKPGKAGKAGKTGPGQTKPRLGTTGKPAKQFRAEKTCRKHQKWHESGPGASV